MGNCKIGNCGHRDDLICCKECDKSAGCSGVCYMFESSCVPIDCEDYIVEEEDTEDMGFDYAVKRKMECKDCFNFDICKFTGDFNELNILVSKGTDLTDKPFSIEINCHKFDKKEAKRVFDF